MSLLIGTVSQVSNVAHGFLVTCCVIWNLKQCQCTLLPGNWFGPWVSLFIIHNHDKLLEEIFILTTAWVHDTKKMIKYHNQIPVNTSIFEIR